MRIEKLAIGMLLAASTAQAAVVFDDTFENGSGTATKADDAFDATDVAWYNSLNNGTVPSVVSDSFAGGGSTQVLAWGSSDTFRRVGANFPSTTLATGDVAVLTFDVRLSESPTSNQWGFRFGLYNSAGTNITTDSPNGLNQPAQQNDDAGYFVRFATGAPATVLNEIYDEPAGDNPLGGTIGGTLISTHSGTPASINDQVKHSFVYSIERVSASQLDFELYYDGVLKATGSDIAGIVTTFDTIYFGQGSVSTDFRFDNVKLEVVPEPATIGLLAVSGVLMGRRRRA